MTYLFLIHGIENNLRIFSTIVKWLMGWRWGFLYDMTSWEYVWLTTRTKISNFHLGLLWKTVFITFCHFTLTSETGLTIPICATFSLDLIMMNSHHVNEKKNYCIRLHSKIKKIYLNKVVINVIYYPSLFSKIPNEY